MERSFDAANGLLRMRLCGVRSCRAKRSAGAALGAALMLASCAAPPPVAPPSRREAGGHLDRRRQYRARRLPELRLPLSRPDPELSGDRQDAAVPRRRRQRATRPFEPAWRSSLGGPGLQRPDGPPGRAGKFRPEPARPHRRVLPRQQRDARARRDRPPADRPAARRFRPQRGARRSAARPSTRPIRARDGSGRPAASRPSSTRPRASSATSTPRPVAPSAACR